jgi:hypothetical protein
VAGRKGAVIAEQRAEKAADDADVDPESADAVVERFPDRSVAR